MPYTWVDNEIFMRYKGIVIYHVYKNDMEQEGSRFFHFGLSPCSLDDDGLEDGVFDVRELYIGGELKGKLQQSPISSDLQQAAIRENIDKGVIICKEGKVVVDTKRLKKLRSV